MTRIFVTALALTVCVMHLSISEAQSANHLGEGVDAARPELVLRIKNDKEQMEKNKACGPGKVFVKNEGCVKREKADKMKAKEKEAKEKAKTQPAPPPPPAVKKGTCCTVGTGTYKYCADTENEAYLKAQATMIGQTQLKPINCGPAN